MNDPKRDISVDEVIPPGIASQTNPIAARLAASNDPTDRAVARILAKYLDDLIPIPGTKMRIGLDPILALFPAVGDTVASGAGVIILFHALRTGVSIPVFLRMALNMGINFLIGLVPGIGAAGSAFFKSNSRNMRLLSIWQAGNQDKVRRSTWRFYVGLLILLGLVAALIIAAWVFYAWVLYKIGQKLGLLT